MKRRPKPSEMESFHDVTLLLTVRFWAEDKESALEQFCDTEISITESPALVQLRLPPSGGASRSG